MYAHTRDAAARVGAAIRARLQDEVKDIRVFGSRVRGDHGTDSDLDLLVVVGARSQEVERAVIVVASKRNWAAALRSIR